MNKIHLWQVIRFSQKMNVLSHLSDVCYMFYRAQKGDISRNSHRTCSCVKGNYIDISFKLQTNERKSPALISFSLEFIVRHESWFHFIHSLAKLSLSPLVTELRLCNEGRRN